MEASVTCRDTEGDLELGSSGLGRLGDLEPQGDARSPGSDALVSGVEESSSRFSGGWVFLEFWFARSGFGRPEGNSSPVPAVPLVFVLLGMGGFRLTGLAVMTGISESSSESEAQGSKGSRSAATVALVTGFEA